MKLTPTDLYQFSREGLYSNNTRDFYKDTEEAFEFSHFPDRLKSRIHYLAYEGGHSAGYEDMVAQYFDLVDLAKMAREKNETT